jgi:hypothetical protein
MESPALEDFQWLVTPEAVPLLDLAHSQFSEGINVVRIAKGLRKQTTAARSAIVMEQAQLRLRAKLKFSQAKEMFFTRRGLEQATGESLAQYKAGRFAGVGELADFCCGIGGDLIGLAARDGALVTVGIDSDPIAVLFAAHNCKHVVGTRTSCEIRHQEFAETRISDWEGLHFDPDRRVTDRTVLGSRFSPPLHEIFSRISARQHISIKVAPATPTGDEWPIEVEREWIGDRRECKQQVLWTGRCCRHAGGRSATMVDGDKIFQLTGDNESKDRTVEISGKIKEYLYEPHPTVLAAGLIGELAATLEIARIASDIDYLTSTKRHQHPLMASFEVVESMPLSVTKAVDYLKSHSIGAIEVKNRGASKLVYDKFASLKLKGDFRATVILTRIGLQQWVVISRRAPTDFPV